MVICPRCCEYYQFQEVQHDRKNNRYLCVFSCDCPQPLRLEENEAEQKGYLADEEVQDALHEKKFELIQSLITEQSRATGSSSYKARP